MTSLRNLDPRSSTGPDDISCLAPFLAKLLAHVLAYMRRNSTIPSLINCINTDNDVFSNKVDEALASGFSLPYDDSEKAAIIWRLGTVEQRSTTSKIYSS
ncbi:hypothetical protein GJ496_005743 [Pomphorhynchus laevis]|nr:hypothetical protein GJ496_005743 [Pomphorhynchus laevis]